MFVYDFKFDDLTIIAYNTLLKYRSNYKRLPKFYIINFDDLSRSHRCNPLDPHSMTDITDATEASRTIMLGLNSDRIKKQGDFFVESPINFLTAIIWYLRKYENGRYCTLPHVIELMQADYDPLFAVLQQEEEIKVLINPFVFAFQNKAKEQLEGQIASAKIGLARLSSPQLYYVLSGNDFTLDVNNPKEPKIVSVGNNPQKLQVYGAVLSLYISRMIKLVNRKDQLKSSLVFDEFPTIYFNNIDSLIATARSNKVATTLAVQDFSQLKKDYGAEQADVIAGIVGNIISGQVTGDTAKKLSLSSGEFVGIVADNPDCKIKLKVFHSEIQNDHDAIKKEENNYRPIPVIGKISATDVQENYLKIKADIENLFQTELKKIDGRKPQGEEHNPIENIQKDNNNSTEQRGLSM